MGWGENDRGVSFTFGAEVRLKAKFDVVDTELFLNISSAGGGKVPSQARLWLDMQSSPGRVAYHRSLGLEKWGREMTTRRYFIQYMSIMEGWKLTLAATCRWWRMVTNSLRSASWSHSSPLPTTVASLTTPVSQSFTHFLVIFVETYILYTRFSRCLIAVK